MDIFAEYCNSIGISECKRRKFRYTNSNDAMKTIWILITLMLALPVLDDLNAENKVLIVKVYNMDGVQLAKGKIDSVTQTDLYIKARSSKYVFGMDEVGIITTIRPAYTHILIGMLAGAVLLGIPISQSLYIFSPGDIAWFGLLSGSVVGGSVGALTLIPRKPKTYQINGDPVAWGIFKADVQKRTGNSHTKVNRGGIPKAKKR